MSVPSNMYDESKDGATERTICRRRFLASGTALAGTAALAGCLGGGGGDATTTGGGTGETDGGGGDGGGTETTNVAIVSSPAGFDDNAFNDLALEGLQTASEEYDIEINQVEETEQAQYQSTQANLAQSGDYGLIVLVSYNHTEALTQNAADYPDQNWMLINDYVDQPNVAGYTWANHQMSYLAGVLGGTMTTEELTGGGGSTNPDTAQIGFVGGVDGSLINAFERSYVAGAEWVNSDVQVNVGYIGNYTDTSTAADIASSQYDDGADIVYHAAAAAGRGVFEAAQENERLAIGVDADQSATLPDFQDVIIGSAVKYINEGTREVAVAVAEDDFQSVAGSNTLGLADEAVDCVIGQAYEGQLPDAVQQNLDEAKQGILNGDITVPCTAAGCN
ncbi:BMP family ABC transporter substrate-binding protein [Halogeometricum sp. S1BR25-6]|uniref:BMP family ABC transporter substrate-binding protein n=1 Tax=Halogeometricum salsisoli TaxID=2950536 RepID=A0ABU2GID7_9EURY|nr:BMP family ABC transporter substrate-binding protein [Halogeometricum sp. S1BR25-6]MDS0300049.1 BMP family ABC transporter substrate-binding protein [Halogeometricum sp. S1BR25-6]